MKNKFIIGAFLALTSVGAWAQARTVDNGIQYTDQYIIIDMVKACYGAQGVAKCDLNQHGIPFVMNGTGTNQYVSAPNTSKLISSIPIGKVEIDGPCGNERGVFVGNTLTGRAHNANTVHDFGGMGVNEVNINGTCWTYAKKVYLLTGIPVFLRESFAGAGNLLKSSYAGVLRNVTSFRSEIARSHRGHLERFMRALTDGITLLDAKDAQTRPLYTVMDWRIQENSRLVVVFGTVLNELLTDYDDVERLKVSIQSMRTLVEQLRLTYGWQRGLAGTVSKASSSLIDVVRLELQELASIKMAMGSGDFTIYMDLLRITRGLQAKVDASRSGDMKAQREIFEFLDKWNDKLWQDEMARLMNAGPDFKNLVVPKLSMLIYAMESIAELTEMEFVIPNRDQLTK